MSISSAPAAATSAISRRRASSGPSPLGNPPGHARDRHAGAPELLDRHGNELGVEADGRDRRDRRIERVRADRLRAHRDDLAGRVGALERREVDAPDRKLERLPLGLPLDRPGGERGGPALETDRVDRGGARHEPGRIGRRRHRRGGRAPLDLGCLGHASLLVGDVPHRSRPHAGDGRRYAVGRPRPCEVPTTMRTLIIGLAAALTLGSLAACSSSNEPACDNPVSTTSVDVADFSYDPSCVGRDGRRDPLDQEHGEGAAHVHRLRHGRDGRPRRRAGRRTSISPASRPASIA